jgi:beta-mannosidase
MPDIHDLNGPWQIRAVARFDGAYDPGPWLDTTVPSHWQQTPALADHTGKAVYRKRFPLSPEPNRRYFLRLNGVFYWCTAYLNGARLGANEGYFFPVEYEITDLLRADNTLLLEVDCPREDDKSRKRQITGVFHHWDCLDPGTNPGGVWLPVEIVATGPARISDPLFTTAYLGKDNASARITGQAAIDTAAPARLTVRISFSPRTFAGETQVFERQLHKAAGVNTYHYHLDLQDPTLWWTHDHGRPDLYTLKYEVFLEGEEGPSDVWETAYGVRTFEMRDYIAYLNGRRMFIRGNNYPPGDTRLATMTRQRVDLDLRLAREANLNLLRIHAHVDHPLFYQAADEAGILLWQDFPLQWNYRPEIESQALRQVQRMVTHLGSHPSIAVWCMHNEPINAPDLKAYKPGMVSRAAFTLLIYSQNRERLDPKLARLCRFLDPTRPTTHCSGERGLLRRHGDGHFYFGWYFGPMRWFHDKYLNHPQQLRFVTEFGSQSLPNLDSSKKFMADRLEAIDWKHLQARHHYQGFFMRRFVNPKKYRTLADFIAATQSYQSELNRYHIDRLRALKYKPAGGVTPFMFLDSNPAIQWSVIDYWRVPKASYFALQNAMRPIYAFTILDRSRYRRGAVATVPIYAVNDTWDPAPVTVTLQITSPVGDHILTQTYTRTLDPDSETQALANPELVLRWEGTYKILISLEGPGGRMNNQYQLEVR